MNNAYQQEFLSLIDKFSRHEGINETLIPGVFCFKATTTEKLTPSVYDPSLCIIAQGHKQAMLAKEVYHYGPSQYLIVSVDLPIIGQVTEASEDKPYLCMKIGLDLKQLSDLLIHTGRPESKPSPMARGLFVGKLNAPAGESIVRLARLLEAPDDIPILAPMMIREIYYRLLRGNYGNAIAQVALKGSNMQRIAAAIQQIRSNLNQPISVRKLSEHAGMSVSSFHAHFKSVTAMSPLQFQKHLRLMEARQLMFSSSIDAANTAYRVGYESPSQFSREYARLFGNPPGRDISLLKSQPIPP